MTSAREDPHSQQVTLSSRRRGAPRRPPRLFYFGWRYGIAPSLVVLPWFAALLVINPQLAFVVIAADHVILALEAWRVAKVKRVSRPGKKPSPDGSSRFSLPLFAFTSVFITFAVMNAAIIALLFAATLWSQGHGGRAAEVLLVGAPACAWVMSLIFRRTADAIDDLVVEGERNPFRQGWRGRSSRGRAA